MKVPLQASSAKSMALLKSCTLPDGSHGRSLTSCVEERQALFLPQDLSSGREGTEKEDRREWTPQVAPSLGLTNVLF